MHESDPCEPSGPSASDVRAFAMRLLGVREYAVGEMTRRLQRKWPESELIDPVVAELVAEDLLSETRFCEAFVRSRQAKLQGPLKIRSELGARGVSDSDSSDALSVPEQAWTELAAEWLNRQGFSGGSLKEKSRYYRRLVNRGFTHAQAMGAIDSVIG